MVQLDSSLHFQDSSHSEESPANSSDLTNNTIDVTAYRKDMLRLFDKSSTQEPLLLEDMLERGITYASLHYLLAGCPNREEVIALYIATKDHNEYKGVLYSRVSWEKVRSLSFCPGSIMCKEELDKNLSTLIQSSEFLRPTFLPQDVIDLMENKMAYSLIKEMRFIVDHSEESRDTLMKVSLEAFPEPMSLVSEVQNKRSKEFLRHLQAYQDFKKADIPIDPDDKLMPGSKENNDPITLNFSDKNIYLK